MTSQLVDAGQPYTGPHFAVSDSMLLIHILDLQGVQHRSFGAVFRPVSRSLAAGSGLAGYCFGGGFATFSARLQARQEAHLVLDPSPNQLPQSRSSRHTGDFS